MKKLLFLLLIIPAICFGQSVGGSGSANEWSLPGDLTVSGSFSQGIEISGQYSDTTNQKPANTNATVITFNIEDITEAGLSHSVASNTENFIVDYTTTYTFMLAPQWERTSSGSEMSIDFWIQKANGAGFVNVANSNVKELVSSKESGVMMLAASIECTANDTIRFMQRISDTGNGLGIVYTTSDGVVPITPSVILTVLKGK